MNESPYMSRTEVCNLLGVESQTLTYWLRKCKISEHRVGRQRVIHRDAVRSLVTHYEERQKKITCQHSHALYTEHWREQTTWGFTDGEITTPPVNKSDRVRVVEVVCEDCGFHRKFRLKEAPKWVLALRQTVLERSCTLEP